MPRKKKITYKKFQELCDFLTKSYNLTCDGDKSLREFFANEVVPICVLEFSEKDNIMGISFNTEVPPSQGIILFNSLQKNGFELTLMDEYYVDNLGELYHGMAAKIAMLEEYEKHILANIDSDPTSSDVVYDPNHKTPYYLDQPFLNFHTDQKEEALKVLHSLQKAKNIPNH